jgi:hypothetical protein
MFGQFGKYYYKFPTRNELVTITHIVRKLNDCPKQYGSEWLVIILCTDFELHNHE